MPIKVNANIIFMVNPTYFHGIAKDLFGRLGINYDESKDPNSDLINILVNGTEGDLDSLKNNMSKFSTFELIKLSKPEEFDKEIKRLEEKDTSNGAITADVKVLEDIFNFTSTMNEETKVLREKIGVFQYKIGDLLSESGFKFFADLLDKFTLATANLEKHILKPIKDSLCELYNRGYQGELLTESSGIKFPKS